MAKEKPAASETPPQPIAAPRETTELHVPQTMHIEQTGPEPSQEAAPEGEEQPRQESPREAMMRRIVENRQKKQEEELKLAETMADEARERSGVDGEEQPPLAAAAAEPAAAAAPAAPPPAAPATAQPAPQPMRTIRVDGRDISLTEDEFTRLAQLGLSANNRFEEAARLRREAEALRTNPAPQGAVPAQQPAPQAPATQDVLDANTARELAKRVMFGSEEDGAKAVQDLAASIAKQLQGRSQATPEQIAATATHMALQQVRFESNLETIGREYPAIFADEDLTLAAVNQVGKLRQKYFVLQQPKTELDIYREACNTVSDKFIKPVTQSTEPPQPQPKPTAQAAPAVQPSADKLERKRAAPQPLAAANAKASLGQQAPRAPTGSEIVSRMRQLRGQPAMN